MLIGACKPMFARLIDKTHVFRTVVGQKLTVAAAKAFVREADTDGDGVRKPRCFLPLRPSAPLSRSLFPAY